MKSLKATLAPLTVLLALLLSACSSMNSGTPPSLETVTPRYIGTATVPKHPIKVGDNLELTVQKLEIGQFPWGKSRFFAMQLPASSEPYYLVLKSYFVSPVTNWRYSQAETGTFWGPSVFFPYLVFFDKDMNVISHSQTADFQVNANIHNEMLIGFRGDTWLQGAFPVLSSASPKPAYAIFSSSSDYVGKVGAVPNFYWPYPDHYWMPRIIYAPKLDPVPTYKGPMNYVRYGNVGEIQVQVVRPQELLETTYGKKLESPVPKTILSPGTTFHKEKLVIKSPNADGYGLEDASSDKTVNMVFTKSLNAGQGFVTMFAQAFHSRNQNRSADERMQFLVDDAIKEHSVALVDFTSQTRAFSGLTGHCKRIDFAGKQPRSFLGTIQGYDIICADGNSDLAIRIGASILSSPAYPGHKALPVEAADFAAGISLTP